MNLSDSIKLLQEIKDIHQYLSGFDKILRAKARRIEKAIVERMLLESIQGIKLNDRLFFTKKFQYYSYRKGDWDTIKEWLIKNDFHEYIEESVGKRSLKTIINEINEINKESGDKPKIEIPDAVNIFEEIKLASRL